MQRMLVVSSGTRMVFYEQDLEDVYLQSIPIVLAYNKVNHYTATKLISQKEFQSWKIQVLYVGAKLHQVSFYHKQAVCSRSSIH